MRKAPLRTRSAQHTAMGIHAFEQLLLHQGQRCLQLLPASSLDPTLLLTACQLLLPLLLLLTGKLLEIGSE